MFSVEKAIATEITILLIEVNVLKEVTEEVRQTKGNSSLVREQMLNVVTDVTRKAKIRLLSHSYTLTFTQ